MLLYYGKGRTEILQGIREKIFAYVCEFAREITVQRQRMDGDPCPFLLGQAMQMDKIDRSTLMEKVMFAEYIEVYATKVESPDKEDKRIKKQENFINT